jgi:hypothetical protein
MNNQDPSYEYEKWSAKIHERHLRAELDARLRDVDDPEMVRRFGFIKNPYRGDTA